MMRGKKQKWSKIAMVGVFTIGFMGYPHGGYTQEIGGLDKPSFHVTQDRFTAKPALNVTLGSDYGLVAKPGIALLNPLKFYIYTNYPDYISQYKIIVYAKDDLEGKFPLKTITTSKVNSYQALEWDGKLDSGKLLEPGKSYRYQMEVTNEKGQRDYTLPKFFMMKMNMDLDNDKMEQVDRIPGFGVDSTAQRGIVPQGEAVDIYGRNIPAGSVTFLNDMQLGYDDQGSFVRELILPYGKQTFTLKVKNPDGIEVFHGTEQIDLTLPTRDKSVAKQLEDNDLFFIGLADVTVGKNSFRGHIEPVAQDDHFNGKLYKDGRLAFYLKGKVQGKYLVTAQLDTGEDGLGKMFKQLGDKDPTRIFREIDPDRYYPVYGDDSTLTTDVQSQGKFYVRVDWDKSHALWGNYNTGLTGTELAQYDRSLYGFQFYRESQNETKFGDSRSLLTGFLSTGETRQDHNEFLSTGGSLYYLIHQRLTEGSEKITLEVRDKDSDRLKGKTVLVAGADYDIDAYQGRIVLKSPLPFKAASDTIISSSLQNGDRLVLVVDYEYYDDGCDWNSNATGGVRGYRWLNDHVKIGGTYVKENRDNQNYQLMGFDSVVKAAKGTYFNFELVKSEQVQIPGYYSTNGGLTFGPITSLSGIQQGKAWKLEQVVDFREITTDQLPLKVRSYYSFREKGFSSLGKNAANDTKEYGLEGEYLSRDGSQIWTVKHNTVTEQDVSDEKTTTVQVKNKLSSDLSSVSELRYRKGKDDNGQNERDLIGAYKLEKAVNEKTSVYAVQQITLNKSEETPNNNKTTLGVTTWLNPAVQLSAEGFTGNLGSGGNLGVAADLNTKMHVYTKLTSDVDSTSGRTHGATFGGDYRLNDVTNFYSERQFISSSQDSSVANVFGVKYLPDKHRVYELSYSVSRLTEGTSTGYGGENFTKREAGSVGYAYTDEKRRLATKLEIRSDHDAEHKLQYVTSNSGKYVENNEWTWYGKFNYSLTENKTLNSTDARYMEASLGVAYRPVHIDRLNLLGKITWLQDLGPAFTDVDVDSNLIVRDSNTDERSHVVSLEAIYDMTSKYSLGAKYARKWGWMRLRDGDGTWATADTDLVVTRLNYHVNKSWDALLEYRWLEGKTAQDAKSGWLLGVNKHLNENFLLGVGYNFTDFNDDLTNLSYHYRGWFVNMVGKW